MRINLTDARIRALRPDPDGKRRLELRDAVVPGLIVRVATRRKTFMLHSRFPGAKHPTRRAIGEWGAVTIDGARLVARQWLEQIRKGEDPQLQARRRADEARRVSDQQQRRQEGLFARVAADYLKRRVAGQRRAGAVGRIVNNALVPAWGDKPVTTISRRDVVKLVEQIDDRGAPLYAAAVFGITRTLFNWAINRGSYELEHSPCDRVKVGELVSRRKQPRSRVLSDDELRALWKASGRLPYPWGPLFQLLTLTGLRKTEAAGGRWPEIDLERKVWSIPSERFKSNAIHMVPLSADALAIIESLPRFQQGDHMFSFSYGRTPALILHSAKLRLDALMLRYLRALTRLRGGDPAAVTLEPWVTHDLRHVVRTRLAALEVTDTVAEMCIGHGRKGLARTYDQHTYQPQMRRAFELWAAELRRIVSTPQDDNVVPLRGQGA
jgi:integrase